MTSTRRRIAIAVGSIVTAAALAGLAIYLGRQGLDRADKISSVLGVLLNALALLVAVLGLFYSWWSGRQAPPRRTRQVIRGADTATITARRAQRGTGGDGDVEQEISGSGNSRINVDDVQSVNSDDP